MQAGKIHLNPIVIMSSEPEQVVNNVPIQKLVYFNKIRQVRQSIGLFALLEEPISQ